MIRATGQDGQGCARGDGQDQSCKRPPIAGNGTQLKACEDAGITTYVPKPMTSGAKAEGRLDKGDFIYIAKD